MLRLAVEWGELPSASTIKRLPGERHREHVVSYDEEARYLDAGSELLASIATVLIDTGMRPEECYRLRWESITWANGRNGTLLVTHGKTAAARRVLPMTPRVREILENRWERTGRPLEGWTWPAPTLSGSCRAVKPQETAPKGPAIGWRPSVLLYSLRHTFLTRLGESGCDAWTLARIAGHSSITISNRYVHPSEDAVLSAMSRLGGHKTGHSVELEDSENAEKLTLSA
jgi:integrase